MILFNFGDSIQAKAGSCEICDEKFEDEEAHVKSAKHQACLEKKRHQFERVLKSCTSFFPNGIDGFLNRLDEFNAGPVPSPMPISVLTEPDSELSVQEPAKVEELAKSEPKAEETADKQSENKEPLYRETKVESSFEAKNQKTPRMKKRSSRRIGCFKDRQNLLREKFRAIPKLDPIQLWTRWKSCRLKLQIYRLN